MVPSLRAQLVVTLVGLVLLGGLWQVWFSYSAASRIIERDAVQAVGLAAEARRQALLNELRHRYERVGFFLPQLRGQCVNGTSALCAQMLRTVVSSDTEVTGALLDSPRLGRIGAGEWEDVSDGPLAPGQLARFGRDRQERPYFVISISLDQEVSLIVRCRMEPIDSIFLDPQRLGESGEAFLTDGRAFFLTPARYAQAAGHSHPIEAGPMEMCLSGQDTEVLDEDYRGVDVVHGFRYVPQIGGGCVMVHLDQAEAFLPADRLRRTLFLGTGVFGLVAIGLGAFAARVLARPIHALSRTAASVAAGDLGARAAVTTSDEVGILGRTFNTMLDALETNEAALRHAHDELQLRVDERTAEVRQANETLRAQIAEREQAEATVRAYAKRLEALKAIDRGILGAPSPEALAEVTLRHVRGLVPCLRTSITLFDLEAGHGTIYAAKDEHSEQRELAVGSRVPLSAYGDPATLAHGIVTLVSDISALPRTPFLEALAARGIRSWINVPLLSQDELFGTLNIAWESPDGFSVESVALAREVADGVALGIRQARLLEQIQRHAADLSEVNTRMAAEVAERSRAEDTLRRHARRLEGLHGLQRSILAAGSPQAVAQIALGHIRHAVPCRRASVAVFDVAAAEASVFAVQGDGETRLTPGTRVPLAIFGDVEALRRGALNVVADAEALPTTPVLDVLKAEGLRAWINVPLIVEGELIGTLNLEWDSAAAFAADYVVIATEVAESLAIAFQQARLHERVQQHAAELEGRVARRTAELEAFSYSISHDLRRPLRAIDGFSRMLLDRYAGKMDDEFNRLLNIVRSSAQDMTELTDGLLAVSRVGRQEMRPVDVDMKDLAKGVCDELGATAVSRHVEFVIGELPPARGDRAMLRQVFVNLLSNAVKFTGPRDRALIEVGHLARADGPVYYVRDNGVGFDDRYLDKIFGVFERLHHPDEFEGTGVGLAIVKRIIERHGGQVSAEGKVNEGAALYFWLPVTDIKAPGPHPGASE